MYKNHKRSINSWREPGREWFLDGKGTRKAFFDRDEEGIEKKNRALMCIVVLLDDSGSPVGIRIFP